MIDYREVNGRIDKFQILKEAPFLVCLRTTNCISVSSRCLNT